MTTYCPKSVNGMAMRLTQTDVCGVPETGAGTQVATSGFITLGIGANIEAGTEITVKKADGSLCIARKQGDQLKWLDLSMELCGIPYPALALLLGVEALMSSDDQDIIGGVLPSRTAQAAEIVPVQLEVWSINADADACAGGASGGYIHWVVPIARNFQLAGDITFGEDAANLSLTGIGESSASFISSSGVAGDVWTEDQELVIQGGGPLAWRIVDSLPTLDDCDFVSTGS